VTTIEIGNFRAKYEHLKNNEQSKDQQRLAGRIVFKRVSSSKLYFYKLAGDGSYLQILANFTCYRDSADFVDLNENILKRGDIVGVVGFPARSKTGELSIVPTHMEWLSPCLYNLPHPETLKDTETRYRQRYLDLISNESVRKTFIIRSQVLKFIRNFFDDRSYLEVETPILNVLPGGAAAKPFSTHHNDLHMDMFLRISPELYLKQLVVGGLEKVYEIGKNFRNEGIDLTHNPEFTAIESYCAYVDYEDLMTMTEDLLSSMVLKLTGSYVIKYHHLGKEHPESYREIDFTPPFTRIPMIETLEKKIKCHLS